MREVRMSARVIVGTKVACSDLCIGLQGTVIELSIK